MLIIKCLTEKRQSLIYTRLEGFFCFINDNQQETNRFEYRSSKCIKTAC